MKYYVSSVKEFMSDGSIVGWLTSKVYLVVNDPTHVSAFVQRIKEQLCTLRQDLTMVVETEYVDAVYRDSYYSYFSTKLKSYRRFCIRLSFFENIFSSIDEFFTLDKTIIKDNYLGFIII